MHGARFIRRGAWVAAAATLLGLASLGGVAVAAPTVSSGAASSAVTSTSASSSSSAHANLMAVVPLLSPARPDSVVVRIMRMGSCSPEMMDL